ncbi:MAG: peptide chain release factor N(5)-glutamine methyltransferase [Burkholderiaceae bacterium]
MNWSTVVQALAFAGASGLDALDGQILLSRCLARPRSWLLAHDDAQLDAGQRERFAAAVLRRRGGEPLAYLIGEKEFCGLLLHVERAVLIPRPETEHLVEWGLEILGRRPADPAPLALDLGTGSGAIALALKAALPSARVEAVDVDAQALRIAQGNAQRLALDVRFQLSDWWRATEKRRFDLVLCNPPYVAKGDPHLAALAHEPALALTPGTSGLEALHKVIEGAPAHLRVTGWLLLEHGFDQAEAVRQLLHEHGLVDIQTRSDLAGLPRCSGARWLGQ